MLGLLLCSLACEADRQFCRTGAEFGTLGSSLNLDHLAELQADAVAKGALNLDRHVEAAAVRGALHLERSQPLSNLEISALAQKVSHIFPIRVQSQQRHQYLSACKETHVGFCCICDRSMSKTSKN